MGRTAALLSTHGGRSIPRALADVLVCPLSKQPLRYCEATRSLASDAAGVPFPVLDGIPCLVPKDGKLLDAQEVKSEQESSTRDSSG
ncbi:uncharacterized protein [Miscanthus floridulus]|uniref:uncharacterized protein n=1 Tax=Miscanthus floridulus TaxID=154761 RepID=UPI00345A1786